MAKTYPPLSEVRSAYDGALKAHLEAASGLAGYVRTLLEVANDRLPPAIAEKLKEKVEKFEATQ